jgi:hypothetical protein
MVTFNGDIKPLFAPFVRCMSRIQFSSPDGTEAGALDDYDFVKRFHSRILTRLKGVNEDGQSVPRMPPGDGLPQADIALFEQWIADGMEEGEAVVA